MLFWLHSVSGYAYRVRRSRKLPLRDKQLTARAFDHTGLLSGYLGRVQELSRVGTWYYPTQQLPSMAYTALNTDYHHRLSFMMI